MSDASLAKNLLSDDELAADVTAIDPQAAPRSRTGGMTRTFTGKLGMLLVSAAATIGMADNAAGKDPVAKKQTGKPPAAAVASSTKITPVATRNGTRSKQSSTRAGEQLPEVNQEVVDEMTREWGTVVPKGSEQAFQRQLEALLDTYRANDEEAWQSLSGERGTRTRSFGTERAAFVGENMRFIGGIDGFETNAGARIRCYYPVDREGRRVGTDFHYIVTGLANISDENVLYIRESRTGTLETADDIKGAIQHLSQRFSTQTPVKLNGKETASRVTKK